MAVATPLDSPGRNPDHLPHGNIRHPHGEPGSPMNLMVEWIATNALLVWVLLLALGVLVGDLAWQWNAHHDAGSVGHKRFRLRQHAGRLLLAVLLFVLIAFAVSARQSGELPRFDIALARSLHAQLPLPLLRAAAVLTHLGDVLWIAPAATLLLVVLLRRRQWRLAAVWALALIGIMPIDGGLKALFQRVRPLHDHGFISEPGWSFPSGHAFGATVFCGMLAYVLLRLLPQRFHRAVVASALGLIGVIGISRILLQVHYLSDVLAGYAGGAAWLVLCIGIAEYLRGSTSAAAGNVPPEPRP